MTKIDSSAWKEFRIGSLFEIKRPSSRSQIDYDDGEVPFVSTSDFNNGIVKYCSPKSNELLDKGNCITVSPLDGSAFYQENDFLGRGGAGSAIILLYNKNLNRENGLYISTVIRKNLVKYSYNNQLTSSVIENEKLLLPQLDNNPDWKFMEKYVINLQSSIESRLNILNNIKNIYKKRLSTEEWGTFHLYDLFEIDSGTKLDKVKMDTSSEEINFVGRSNENNGITARVKRIDGLTPFGGGNLTLALGGAYLGSCFVQPEPFYTSQNVNVLIPKVDMSFFSKQFIATTIFVESQNNYQAFIKELNAHVKTDFVIKLPITQDKSPDFKLMETIMKNIEKKW